MATKQKTLIALMSALCFLLSWLKIPIIPMAPFLTLDLYLLPIIMLVLHREKGAYTTLFLSTFLVFLFNGFDVSVMIGWLAQVVFGCVLIEGLTHHRPWWWMTITVLLAMVLLNQYIVLPLYEQVLHFQLPCHWMTYMIGALIPFNLIKIGEYYLFSRMFCNIR